MPIDVSSFENKTKSQTKFVLVSIEQFCQILVLSDQLLIERLKQICEFHIANLVTFRDAAELLQFSATYNAEQLKAFVEQFICRNMATFLEGRLLDHLDNQLLNDLTKSYRKLVRENFLGLVRNDFFIIKARLYELSNDNTV